jgi:carbamoyl-phosphate synthase large subunit
MFIQQFVEGDEYHCDVINDLEGNYVTTFPKIKLGMRAGETDAAMTCDDEELIRIGEKLGRGLKHVGLLDVDLIKSKNGGYHVIDANPRFGGGYPFSHAAGANIPACLVNWAKGKKVRKEWLTIRPGIVSAKGFRIITSKNTPES